MSLWKWNGARWWKCDLHTHSPASCDYGKGSKQGVLKERTPREWLLDYMRAGIDCVAITDHNSGAWIDDLRNALAELHTEQPEGYRPIHLFAGAEISVHGGVHLLSILGSDKTTSDVDSLLGAVGFSGTRGSSDEVTSKSFEEVVREVVRRGGIAIPAHVDRENGLFRLKGSTLAQNLRCNGIFAMELIDSGALKPQPLSDKKLRWTEILGSDSHHPSGDHGQRFPGSHFTWIKMGSPCLEGLRLALLDGPLSVRRSEEETGHPNQHAPLVLESIEVSNARYMGRAQSFTLRLNPWLNAIIGGRGTGKSSLIEFLRVALRREDELPDDLKPEFDKYVRVYSSREDSGLLTDEAEIRVVYRKNGSRFRIQWSPGGDLDAIQEEVDGRWRLAQGDVAQRFPIRLNSQKQIFHLAKTPMALLKVVDEAPEVDRRSWSNRWRQEESRFFSLRAKAREIEAGLAEETRLKGQLDDVKRMLAVFEDAGHADVLKAFQKRRRQQRAVETWEEEWADAGERLRQFAAELVPAPLGEASLDSESEEDAKLLVSAAAARDRLDAVREALERLAGQVDEILSEWRTTRNESAWKNAVAAAIDAYDSLRERLDKEGAGDPSAYGELVQRRQTIEQRLKELEDRKRQVQSLRDQAASSLKKLLEIRRELTESRTSFVQQVLKDNRYVSIHVVPYGARDTVEAEFRQLLQRESEGFERDIGAPGEGGLLGPIYEKGPLAEEIGEAVATLRKKYRGREAAEAERLLAELRHQLDEADLVSEHVEEGLTEVARQMRGGDAEQIEDSTSRLSNQIEMARIEKSITELKRQIQLIAVGSHDPSALGDQRFARYVGGLQPEVLDRLDLWFPEDSLDVRYSATGDGRNLRSIEEGSPGQRTAALLAFLLSYGEEPLVLDQPEDDLDNHLIYELIVAQLREVKTHRQIIVVTHNPNIVVNGDAELVVALTARSGETHKECEGSLQEKQVRDTICDVMEGGRDAFEQRYRRIALEASHV